MTYPAKEIIKKRKSVRTFDGRSLSSKHLKLLEQHINSQSNPFGVPVAFRLLDTKEHELSSPVILGEEKYLAAKVKRVPRYEIALGYSFEEACCMRCRWVSVRLCLRLH